MHSVILHSVVYNSRSVINRCVFVCFVMSLSSAFIVAFYFWKLENKILCVELVFTIGGTDTVVFTGSVTLIKVYVVVDYIYILIWYSNNSFVLWSNNTLVSDLFFLDNIVGPVWKNKLICAINIQVDRTIIHLFFDNCIGHCCITGCKHPAFTCSWLNLRWIMHLTLW